MSVLLCKITDNSFFSTWLGHGASPISYNARLFCLSSSKFNFQIDIQMYTQFQELIHLLLVAQIYQWIGQPLVQIMASCLFGASHYLNQCWFIVKWTLRNKLQWNYNQNTKLFINKSASEDFVCEMAAILSRGRWVKNKSIIWWLFCIERLAKTASILKHGYVNKTRNNY